MDVELVVARDHAEAAALAAERLVAAARAGGAVALSGGSSPRPAYELAASLEPDWSAADVWLGDERCVPEDDDRSNARLVRESLLERLGLPPEFHPVRTELPPAAAADEYDLALRDVRLALALQGLGPDGHTASLFPHAPALEERERRAVATAAALEPWVDRVTMTVPFLCAAAEVVFLAVGEAKAEAARRAFAEPPSPAAPASLVRSREGRTTAILDEAAAALLP